MHACECVLTMWGFLCGVFPPTFFCSFNILVFGEIKRQWSLARPLLSLILACEVQRPKVLVAVVCVLVRGGEGRGLSPHFVTGFVTMQSFDEFKVEFMRHQPKEAHAGLIKAFSTLMDGVKT